jgi:hypothetical protein
MKNKLENNLLMNQFFYQLSGWLPNMKKEGK